LLEQIAEWLSGARAARPFETMTPMGVDPGVMLAAVPGA